MLIREAAEAELPEILGLLKDMDGEEGMDSGGALAIWRKMKEYPCYKVFVAEDNNTLIGTCSLIVIDNLGHKGAKLAVAESMIVSPGFRGLGVGSRLMRFVMERAKEENCYKLMLSSNKKRIPAHRFYERLGFEQHGISFMIALNEPLEQEQEFPGY
ncbi:GCN5-related N-acetyltransferase [Desulfocucumis palustris]|uniref:GCN5-related N-acetyltransferase n=1 Tax=Desulfocucumis palustris TaxID=1898651 RepID=A0A2L2XCZ9_9FIRM|nr:GNAT family N-acetyltransferase [Desulfocucumis palustris]GBF34002.1 GCN5-related N-acetyltransferase [Desulfocucumis palustris]